MLSNKPAHENKEWGCKNIQKGVDGSLLVEVNKLRNKPLCYCNGYI